MNRPPTISIIIPCFQAEAYLGETLRSARDQTRPPLEILVVDNGSTDGGPALAASFGPPVRLLREPSPGANAARLAGAAAARGEALMFLDADDLIDPTTLEALGDALAAAPDAIAVCPWRRFEREGPDNPSEAPQGASVRWIPGPPSCRGRRRRDDDLAAWLSGWWVPPCGVLWSREAYRRSGGWDLAVRNNQDGDVIMRSLVAGARLARTSRGAAFYRRLPEGAVSLSARRFERPNLESRIAVIERIERLLLAQNTHAAYARPLAKAYAQLAGAAEAHPDLATRCRAASTRLNARPVRPPQPDETLPPLDDRPDPEFPAPDEAPLPETSPAPRRPAISAGRPLVSIVVPALDKPEDVLLALKSALRTSCSDLEAVVVAPDAADETAARVEALDDPRVRAVRSSNANLARARNIGIETSRGEFVAFLDGGDEWTPDALDRRIAALDAAPERVGLVYGAEARGGGSEVELRPHLEGRVFEAILARNRMQGFGSTGFMRRKVFDTVGGFDTRLPALEDWDFLLRATRFFDVAAVDAPLRQRSAGGAVDAQERARRRVADLEARRTLHHRYGADMRDLGVETTFLMDAARLCLGGGLRGRLWIVRALLHSAKRKPRVLAP